MKLGVNSFYRGMLIGAGLFTAIIIIIGITHPNVTNPHIEQICGTPSFIGANGAVWQIYGMNICGGPIWYSCSGLIANFIIPSGKCNIVGVGSP